MNGACITNNNIRDGIPMGLFLDFTKKLVNLRGQMLSWIPVSI